MSRLTLSLLGSFEATLDNHALTKFRTNKVQALLIYLAVKATTRPATRYRREALMEFLWPGLPLKSAQENLRQTLYQLRKTIPELSAKDNVEPVPFLLTDRQFVQLNPAYHFELDVAIFTGLLKGKALPKDLEQAVALYRGDFLADFYLPDSDEFEAWAANQRAVLSYQMLDALDRLTTMFIEHQIYDKAETYARQQLEIDSLQENAHRQLMTILARNGRRSQALAQYETLYQLLADELGVEPSAETAALYERIREGELDLASPPVPPGPLQPPPSVFFSRNTTDPEKTVFVGRKRELAQLDQQLELMLTGQGQVAFITGGAGRGKTALLAEFARRAQQALPDLLVAGGNCNAYAGVGDPYLPFREVMELLTGDVEARLAANAMTRDQAHRLWQLTPRTIELLLEHGPHLFNIFIAGKALLSRAKAAVADTAIITQLQDLVESWRPTGLEQSGLFSEYTDFLRHLTEERPLLLTLDDLHWADEASLGLLFHLGRRLEGSRLFIIGAYRPAELVHGRESQPHPLQKVLNEFQQSFGNILIDLTTADQSDGRGFIDALLDSKPNHLGEPFRQAFFQQTGGHPLFAVELLRELQSSGSLVQDEAGQWVETDTIVWQTMPTRIEAVIAQRLGHLDDALRHILRIASVEGERFTIEVIAQVTGLNRRELVDRFSRELVKRHHLLTAQGMERVEDGGQSLSFYRFRHHLFQVYLYQSLDNIERVYQHEAVGNALETLYGEQTDEIATHLARHFEMAGHTAKAITYLWRAGERAIRLSAYEEAIDSLRRGLSWCNALPETSKNAQQKLDLLLSLGEATRKAGQFEESLAIFQQAAGVARAWRLPEALVRVALGYEESRWRFNLPAAPSALLLEEALNALDQTETLLRVWVWVNLARARMAISPPEEFAAMAQQALEMARRINDPVALFEALYLIVRSDRRPEKSAERLAMLEEMLQLSQALDDKERIYDTYGFRLQEFMEMGDMASFEMDYNLVSPLARKLKQPFYNYYSALIPVTQAMFAGRFAEAEKAAQDALEIGQQMRVENVDGVYGMQMFSIRREQGRLPELAPLMRLLSRQNVAAAWRPGLALLYSELDMQPEVQQEFEALAADDFAALPRDAMWITIIAYLAEVCAYLEDEKRAAILYEYLLPYDGRTIAIGFLSFCYGAAARYLGILAATLKRWSEAEGHFESALEMNARIGARPWLAHTQYQYAVVLLACGHDEDRDKACSLLSEALSTAQEFGMKTLLKKIKAIQSDHVL